MAVRRLRSCAAQWRDSLVAEAITWRVAARGEGSSGASQSARGRDWPGPSPLGTAVNTARRGCSMTRGASCPSRVRTLGGPVAAGEVHEAGADGYPGQEGREPPPGLRLLNHSEHFRDHRPVDERG